MQQLGSTRQKFAHSDQVALKLGMAGLWQVTHKHDKSGLVETRFGNSIAGSVTEGSN